MGDSRPLPRVQTGTALDNGGCRFLGGLFLLVRLQDPLPTALTIHGDTLQSLFVGGDIDVGHRLHRSLLSEIDRGGDRTVRVTLNDALHLHPEVGIDVV